MGRGRAGRQGHGGFHLAALGPAGLLDPAVAIAASRAGGVGLVDLTGGTDGERRTAVDALLRHGRRGRCGARVDAPTAPSLAAWLPEELGWIAVAADDPAAVPAALAALDGHPALILVEVVDADEAATAASAGAGAVIARGSETGGRVGEETAFVLAQRLIRDGAPPVWVQGGIGPHTIAACRLAGARGAILDAQLWLTPESPLGPEVRAVLARMDGSETAVLGTGRQRRRVFAAPGLAPVEQARAAEPDPERLAAVLRDRAGWTSPERDLLCLGQDAAFAAPLADRHGTVGGIVTALRARLDEPAHLGSLAPGAPLARDHGTPLPIAQGPMTRVSDRPGFAAAVARAGGLPFVALALMAAGEVDALLTEVGAALEDRPWGVGILGFVPLDVREAQLEVIERHRPPFALIAGGRPDQARRLEERGIATYLHVPSPALLTAFARDGARRFVLEGRECGGHVGPRSSFVLWSQAVDALLHALGDDELAACRVLLAGGIHDARSAAMAATVAAPLAARGAAIGVLMGSAYVFTREAVATGAITAGFQDAALRCEQTVLLESGPGHATRCAPTPFAATFAREHDRLVASGAAPAQRHDRLEHLSLGRLRIAAKGVDRAGAATPGERPALVAVSPEQQGERGLYMLGQVAALRSATTSIEDLHAEVTVGATRLLEAAAARAPRPRPARRPRPADAAIVGMSCILPGAPDLAAFWRNITGGVDAITEIPATRFDWRRWYEADGDGPDAISSRWGGFIAEVVFDPLRWGMPPRSLASIEPLQLLALETAAAALADAGCDRREPPRERTSVILGIGGGLSDLGTRYALRADLPLVLEDVPDAALAALPEWTEDSFAGILLNVAAGRIANRLDLGGANYTVDAACASSLAAIHLAARELECGTSDMVVAGGADTVQNPFGYLCFSKTRALSPTGRCKPFAEDADGIAISEGLAMVVLKRLADAERDGDRIYAVIKGIGSSSDGRAKGLTAPRPEGQLRALRRAYEQAGCSPATVGLVEAHGTGTVAGDRAEVQTLRRAFESAGAPPRACALGSVKSMIGHTKCAAGVAGLVKASLALHHKVLPPTINVERPNPRIGFADSPFHVNTQTRPWVHAADHPRRAGVSAFGFGGTNFHCVVEEYRGGYRPADAPCPWPEWDAEVAVLSASDPAALRAHARRILDALDAGAAPALRDLAAALWREVRPEHGERAAIVAADLAELSAGLRQLAAGGSAPERTGLHRREQPLGADAAVALLFPGQGSQHCDMLRDLAVAIPQVRAAFERADAVLAGVLAQPLSRYVFPPPAFDEQERAQAEAALRATEVAQPALGACGLAMHALLARLGLRAAMTGGHSYGELVALHAAGALDEADLLRLSAARGAAMAAAAADRPGAMAAVAGDAAHVAEEIAAVPGVVAANRNSPRQTVISGPTEAVDAAVDRLAAAGLRAVRLPVACAFHSPAMAGAGERFGAALGEVGLRAPARSVYANVTAAPHAGDPDAIAATLAAHLVEPVRFAEQIEAMYAAGARVFVEAGPHGVLSRLVGETLGDRPHAAVALQPDGRSGLRGLAEGLARLVAEGVPLDLAPLWDGRAAPPALDDLLAPQPAPTVPDGAWIVDGGSARPAGTPAARPQPVSLASASGRIRPEGRSETVTPRSADSYSGDRDPGAGLPASATPRDAAMARFQALMDTFLDDQRDVMLALLDRRGAAAPHGPATADPTTRPATAPAAPAAAPATAAPATGPAAAPVTAAPATAPAPPATATTVPPRFVPVVRDADPPTGPPLVRPGDVVVVAGADHPAAALSERIAGIGARAVPPGGSDGPPNVVVDLRPLATAGDVLTDDVRASRARVGALVTDLMTLCRDAGPDLRAVVAATAMGGTFGIDAPADAPIDPAHGAVAGLVKAIGAEWPHVAAKVVDFDAAAAPAAVADGVMAELLAHDGHVEVGRPPGRRVTIGVAPAPASVGEGAVLGPDAVVLLTGGARGITAEVARALAIRYRPTLVLAGRTAIGGDDARAREARATMDAIAAVGGRVEYRQADVSDPEQLAGVIDDIAARYGRLDGVVHGAGVIDDGALRTKAVDAVARVLDPKVTGALTLARRLPWAGLRFLVLFGSVAGRFGNAGQTDYAAANEFLSKLAADLDRRRDARVVALAWGPWAGAGMVTDAVAQRFAQRGVEVIDPAAGCAALIEELERSGAGEPEIVVGGGPWATESAAPDGGPNGAPDGSPNGARARTPGRGPSAARAGGPWGDAAPGAGVGVDEPVVLHPDRDPLLHGHRLDGRPVLPAAVALEMLAAAAAGVLGEPIRLEDFALLRGAAAHDGPLALRVRVTAPPDTVAELRDAADRTVHYRARATRATAHLDASDLPAPLAATGPFPLSVQELYDRWLWHGPALQAIASIDAYGPDGLDATLRASASGTGSWRLDPVVVDAVFQLGIVWSRQTLDRTALPARVGRVEGAISLPAGTPVRCRLRLTAQAGGGLLTGRAALLDPDDRPLAVLAGIELSCSADLNRLGTAGGPEAEGTAEAAPTADRPEAERTAEAAPTADRPEAERTAETAPTADRPEAERTAETAPTAEMAR